MYFWFFKLKKWGKKTAETRRRNCAVVPYYLTLDMAERRLIIESLNNLRSRLIAAGRFTDAVDELLLKFVNAKAKKFKVIHTV